MGVYSSLVMQDEVQAYIVLTEEEADDGEYTIGEDAAQLGKLVTFMLRRVGRAEQ